MEKMLEAGDPSYDYDKHHDAIKNLDQPQFVLKDATEEKLKTMLISQQHCVAIDGEQEFLDALQAYSNKNASFTPVLHGWDGAVQSVQRQGRGNLSGRTFFSFLVGGQPQANKKLFSSDTKKRGLDARILMYESSFKMDRGDFLDIDDVTRSEWEGLIIELYDLSCHIQERGELLRFTADAAVLSARVCDDWVAETGGVRDSKSSVEGRRLLEMMMKGHQHVARLAGLLCLLEFDGFEVGVRHVEGAVELVEWFMGHTLRLGAGVFDDLSAARWEAVYRCVAADVEGGSFTASQLMGKRFMAEFLDRSEAVDWCLEQVGLGFLCKVGSARFGIVVKE